MAFRNIATQGFGANSGGGRNLVVARGFSSATFVSAGGVAVAAGIGAAVALGTPIAPSQLDILVASRFVTMLRAEPVEQFLNDLNTAALGGGNRLGVGDVRIPIELGRFRVITGVSLTFNGAGAGFSWELVDKDVTIGPRVRVYGPDDLPSDAVIDVFVRGV